jgi:tripartite motif-containing protein 2/3/tripartite motif-containing protein 71
VSGLEPAFHINRFLEIQESLHKLETPAATLEEAARHHADTSIPEDQSLSKTVQTCPDHSGEDLKLYCETCGVLICVQCIMKGGKHHDHDCELIKNAFEKYKEEISLFLEPMNKQVGLVKNSLSQLDMCCREISDVRSATEINIHRTFTRLRDILNARETELINQLDRLTQDKLKNLAIQKDEIETILAQLHSCLHFMNESLKPGNEEDVLVLKPKTAKKVKELTTSFQPETMKPITDADIRFTPSEDTTSLCHHYGQVFTPELPDPSKCFAVIEAGIMGQKSTALLQAVRFDGKPHEELVRSVECDVFSNLLHSKGSCTVERRGQSQYEISYQPTVKGSHTLHIKVEGQHVRGSPFHMPVKAPHRQFESPILSITDPRLVGPRGITTTKKGGLVAVSSERHCVVLFNSSGEKVQSFGSRGSGPGQFHHPRGVAVDAEGNILVTDTMNNRVQMFFPDGLFCNAVGSTGNMPLEFLSPADLAVNPANNKVYVLDRANHRIQILNSDLTFFGTFGVEGNGKGMFSSPYGIACDNDGTVYVTDIFNDYGVQTFTAAGKFQRMFGWRGHDPGELDQPNFIAVDNGVVYVSESGNHRISKFTSEGVFIKAFGSRGKELGQFKPPCGIAVDDSGVVHVCDGHNNRIQVF